VIAIFLVAIGITGLQLAGADSWITPVFNGSVLLLAVALSNFAATRRVLVRAGSAMPRRRRSPAPAPPPPESA
jgi:ribose transport system permease protein